jgi:archaellin
MNPNDQVEIKFGIAGVPVNTKMTIELRPSVGAALPFSKTAPATIANTNVLY